MKNSHLIEAKKLQSTNKLGARLKLRSLHFNKCITVPWDFSGYLHDNAAKHLESIGFPISAIGESGDSVILATATFRAFGKEDSQ
jgi:hypothetical protein